MIPARRRHWERLKRSLGRRWREWRLPPGYLRLGTRYGGWWLDRNLVRADPLLVDCGLGRDISFASAFLTRFGGTVIGVEANPAALAWCAQHSPPGMHLRDAAFWTRAGETLAFHLPRPLEQLPNGADGVSGSLLASHAYVAGGEPRRVTTTDLEQVLAEAGREDCDVLKLDIEGAEYEVLEDLLARGLLGKCRQLLVEFHHGVTARALAETERVVEAVRAAGFRLAHVEGRNYSFFRGDLA
ncbi:MAG: FkbM family methyltransferase [Pseudomonadota bacterium]